ncbi:MAG: hypothetical protein EA356_17735 [Geminicoccaceae bacterium]|nr:MAG: hypothetical protein EA356_17735 [Geminicoccaceae bacterium]
MLDTRSAGGLRIVAKERMTMLVLTHVMGFAPMVADPVIFTAQGELVEQAGPDTFISTPQ